MILMIQTYIHLNSKYCSISNNCLVIPCAVSVLLGTFCASFNDRGRVSQTHALCYYPELEYKIHPSIQLMHLCIQAVTIEINM